MAKTSQFMHTRLSRAYLAL